MHEAYSQLRIDELRVLSMSVNPHIICIVETWLDESIQDRELSIENYNLSDLIETDMVVGF